MLPCSIFIANISLKVSRGLSGELSHRTKDLGIYPLRKELQREN